VKIGPNSVRQFVMEHEFFPDTLVPLQTPLSAPVMAG
jgi:hypothetical protein